MGFAHDSVVSLLSTSLFSKLEKVQRRAARFASGKYKYTDSVSEMSGMAYYKGSEKTKEIIFV